jgi:hypothetical protein
MQTLFFPFALFAPNTYGYFIGVTDKYSYDKVQLLSSTCSTRHRTAEISLYWAMCYAELLSNVTLLTPSVFHGRA